MAREEIDVGLNFIPIDCCLFSSVKQQEIERKEKIETKEKEASDKNLEYINTEDFKPGGKYYEGSREEVDKSSSRADETMVTIKKAEKVLRRNYKSTFKTNLWAQLF